MKGLSSGRYRVIADSEAVGGYAEIAGIALASPEARGLDLELSSAASISGRVVDEDGSAVSGALVKFTHSGTGYWGRGITDADGKFRCGQLTGGAYRAEIFSSPTAQVPLKQVASTTPIVLADGAARVDGVELRIVKFERKRLRGRVIGADGQGVPDVTLRVEGVAEGKTPTFSQWVALPRTLSDATGGFSFEGLPEGQWAVHARAPDGAEGLVTGLEAGAPDVTITVREPAGVDGTLVGYQEPPAAIYARPYPGVGRLVRGQQDGARFHIALPPGSWIVSAMNAHEGDVQRVEVKEGERIPLQMTSRGRARLRGTVVDYVTGAPAAGLICRLLAATDGIAGITRWDVETAPQTDEQGTFFVDPAPAGDVYLSCVGDWNELSTASTLYSVGPGQEAIATLAVVRRRRPPPDGDIGLHFDDNLVTGATAAIPVVRGVRPGSSAAKSGVMAGDVVVAIDGRAIAPLDASGVEMLIINHAPGSPLMLSVLRGSARLDFALIADAPER